MSMEKRVRAKADKMSSRSFVKPPVHEVCRRYKCEEPPSVNGYCFAHWQASKEKNRG